MPSVCLGKPRLNIFGYFSEYFRIVSGKLSARIPKNIPSLGGTVEARPNFSTFDRTQLVERNRMAYRLNPNS